MSTPLAAQLLAHAEQLRAIARDGGTPAQIAAHALGIDILSSQVARLERALDEIAADAMEEAQLTARPRPRHLVAIDCASGVRTHHVARGPGRC